jgi:hypothetical protein
LLKVETGVSGRLPPARRKVRLPNGLMMMMLLWCSINEQVRDAVVGKSMAEVI